MHSKKWILDKLISLSLFVCVEIYLDSIDNLATSLFVKWNPKKKPKLDHLNFALWFDGGAKKQSSSGPLIIFLITALLFPLLLLQHLWMASMILLQTSLKIAFTFGICHHHLAFYLGKRGERGGGSLFLLYCFIVRSHPSTETTHFLCVFWGISPRRRTLECYAEGGSSPNFICSHIPKEIFLFNKTDRSKEIKRELFT
jgi:hypothetical protein